MKNGKSVQELALEINRQQKTKRDFLPYMKRVEVFEHNNELNLGFKIQDNESELFTAPLTKNGHEQLAGYTKIPSRYYDLMRQNHTDLLVTNVKHWLNLSTDRRMIRSLDGNIRSIMSDKYRRLDNYDLINHILPILNEAKAEIESCEVTETKLYLKAITHKVQAEIKKGDLVSAGILITNSEVGKGSLNVQPLVYRLVCSNGMVVNELGSRKFHIGAVNDQSEVEFQNDTMAANDKAFWLKTRDLVHHALGEATFDSVVNKMRASTERKIESPVDAVELATTKYGFDEGEKNDIIRHLIEGGDISSWGLANAVTRTAQDVESYDRSTELESLGYEIMNRSWN